MLKIAREKKNSNLIIQLLIDRHYFANQKADFLHFLCLRERKVLLSEMKVAFLTLSVKMRMQYSGLIRYYKLKYNALMLRLV